MRISFVTVAILAASVAAAQNDSPRIVMLYTAPHPLVTEALDAFKAEVTKTFPNAIFIEKNANGNPAEYGSTVLAGIAQKPTVLVPLSTPLSKLSVDQARGKFAIVFMGVTDPVGAGIADSLDNPGKATGSSDVCPYDAVLRIARQFMPNARKLGAPFNPAEQPAVFGVGQFKKRAGAFGFEIIERQIPSRDELSTEVRGVAGLSDAVLLGSDNLLMENPGLVAKAAAAAGRPVFACDSVSVEKGAVAGVSVRYADIGTVAGKLVVRVLRGEAAGSLPVAVLTEGRVIVNSRAACDARLEIPASLKATATMVEKDFKCVQSPLANPTGATPMWVWVIAAGMILVALVFLLQKVRRRRGADR